MALTMLAEVEVWDLFSMLLRCAFSLCACGRRICESESLFSSGKAEDPEKLIALAHHGSEILVRAVDALPRFSKSDEHLTCGPFKRCKLSKHGSMSIFIHYVSFEQTHARAVHVD